MILVTIDKVIHYINSNSVFFKIVLRTDLTEVSSFHWLVAFLSIPYFWQAKYVYFDCWLTSRTRYIVDRTQRRTQREISGSITQTNSISLERFVPSRGSNWLFHRAAPPVVLAYHRSRKSIKRIPGTGNLFRSSRASILTRPITALPFTIRTPIDRIRRVITDYETIDRSIRTLYLLYRNCHLVRTSE